MTGNMNFDHPIEAFKTPAEQLTARIEQIEQQFALAKTPEDINDVKMSLSLLLKNAEGLTDTQRERLSDIKDSLEEEVGMAA